MRWWPTPAGGIRSPGSAGLPPPPSGRSTATPAWPARATPLAWPAVRPLWPGWWTVAWAAGRAGSRRWPPRRGPSSEPAPWAARPMPSRCTSPPATWQVPGSGSTSLVGRDPSALDEAGVARAVVESVAENTGDAVVAPLLWGAVAGLPGLAAYRAVNTLDAMVGHRSPRYRRFGWAAARLDDLANLVPARVTAVLVALVSGRPRRGSCARCAPALAGTRARTRAGARPPSPGRWTCGWAGSTSTPPGSSGVPSWGPAGPHRPPTSPRRCGCSSAPRRRRPASPPLVAVIVATLRGRRP